MRNLTRLTTVLVLAFLTLAPTAPSGAAAAPPGPAIRLVLLVAVDQFRYDYLTRFQSEYRRASPVCSVMGRTSPTRTWTTTPRSPRSGTRR